MTNLERLVELSISASPPQSKTLSSVQLAAAGLFLSGENAMALLRKRSLPPCGAAHAFGSPGRGWRRTSFRATTAAKDGGSHVTIVMGDVALLNHVMQAIGAAGRGHVTQFRRYALSAWHQTLIIATVSVLAAAVTTAVILLSTGRCFYRLDAARRPR
jgi:hypothetical protein